VSWITANEILNMSQRKAGHENSRISPTDMHVRNSIPAHFIKWFLEYLIAERIEWNW